MPKQIIIAEQHRLAAVFWEDQIQELVVATGNHQVSDIYLGVVENVLPGIDAAFVNIGDPDRNGFIHVTDLGPLRLKRSAGAITELLTPQQKVLVQVMKEPTGNKGPRLTGNISLPGRYLVLMPYGRGVNLSRRIKNDNERNRLRALAVLIKPAGMGLLVRTEAEGRAEEAIIEDLEVLQKQWESIQQEANSTRAPALLNRDDDFIQRVLRDMYTADVNRIVVDSHTGVKRVKQHLVSWSGGRSPEGVLIDHHRDRISILDYFRVNAAIREALKPRVDLPSGGYIIIEPTEALTVIDVNSGSFTRSATARETVLWTNCEAATEIARQLRLRNLAGVIIVDFIDMDSRRDQLQVLEHFNKALRSDKARPQIAQLSELGLVELTRKRQGQNIYELFGQTCAVCGGLGHSVRLPGEAERERPAKEFVEPAVPAILRESRTPEIPEPLDLSPVDDAEDVDLVHHPSYQERGLPNTPNNRRRRRRRLDEPVAKEESQTTKVISRPTPILSGKSEPAAEGELLELGERTVKPQLIKAPKEIDPPEVVAIEMSPEEQDVYAWMGISPLVRLNREIKNPKSVILSVVLPGESDQTEEENEEFAESSSAPSSFALASDSVQHSAPVIRSSAVTPTYEDTEESEPLLVTSSAETSELEMPSDSTASGESDNNRPLIRRRRRRSSATDGEDSSAS
jgi:ribonuclease E